MATVLTRLRINEISSVDRGAGKNVKVFLTKRAAEDTMAVCKECGGDGMHTAKCSKFMKAWWLDHLTSGDGEYEKREFSAQQREHLAGTGAAMPGGGFPIQNEGDLRNAIRAIGRAKNPGAAKAHIKQRARSLGLTRLLPDSWEKRDKPKHDDEDQDRKLIAEMLADRDEKKRKSAMGDFLKAIEADLNVRKALAGAVAAAHEVDDDGERLAAICKSVNQCVDYLAVPGAALHAAVAAISKGNDMTKTMTLEELTTSMEKLTKRNTELERLLKMSEKHRQYMDDMDMDEDEREEFGDKEPDERDAHMEKHPVEKAKKEKEKEKEEDDGDGEKEKRKRDLAKIAELEKRVGAFEAEAEQRICKQLCRDNGLPEADHEMLARLRKADPKAAEDMLKRTRGLAAQANPTLFTELGKGGAGTDDPGAAILTKAQQMMAEVNKSAKTPAERISIEKARMLVREANPELAKAEREIEQRRRMGRAA